MNLTIGLIRGRSKLSKKSKQKLQTTFLEKETDKTMNKLKVS
jgi:hypothetical protein